MFTAALALSLASAASLRLSVPAVEPQPSPAPLASAFAAASAEGFLRDELLDESFHYNYLGAGFAFDSERDGVQLELSYHFAERWIAVMNGDLLSDDGLLRDPDYKRLSAGIGYVYPQSERLHWVSTVEWDYATTDSTLSGSISGDSRSDTGVRVRERVRFAANERLEFFGGVGWTSLGDEEWLLEAGFIFATNEHWAIMARAEDDREQRLTLGVRFAY